MLHFCASGISVMLFSSCLLGSVVDILDDSPIDLGLKLNTCKGVLQIF